MNFYRVALIWCLVGCAIYADLRLNDEVSLLYFWLKMNFIEEAALFIFIVVLWPIALLHNTND